MEDTFAVVPRRATNVTLDPHVLAHADGLKIILSEAVEHGVPLAGPIPGLLIAQFGVFANPAGSGYLLDLQAYFLHQFETVEAPLH